MSDSLFAQASFALHVLLWVQGGLFLGLSLLALVRPAVVARILRAFPRNRVAGLVLTALATTASAWIVYHAALGRFDFLKTYLPLLAILLFVASAWALHELLAVRALAACGLLLGDPILDAILWAPDLLRRDVATAVVYLGLVLAALFFLYPWLYTATLRRLAASLRLRRTILGGMLLLGVLLLALAF